MTVEAVTVTRKGQAVEVLVRDMLTHEEKTYAFAFEGKANAQAVKAFALDAVAQYRKKVPEEEDLTHLLGREVELMPEIQNPHRG